MVLGGVLIMIAEEAARNMPQPSLGTVVEVESIDKEVDN